MEDVANNNSNPGALESMEPSNPSAPSAGTGTGTATSPSNNNSANSTTTNPASTSASAAASGTPASSTTAKRYRATPAKAFACRGYGECSMVFSRSEHLARHVRKHTGERPFACHCGKQFSRLDNLRQHAQTVHADKQDQNERMMRELTSLHTSISQSAKRDARKKSTSQPIPAVAQGTVGMTGPQSSSMHMHPHAAAHPSLVPTPMINLAGPGGYPGSAGHVMGHMHAHSMSALSFDAHQAMPRYGRGRPGTSAGYEGNGFEGHPYDPRRGGWPGAGPAGSGSQPQAGGNGGFDHPGHHPAHNTPPHATSHPGLHQHQHQHHPAQSGFRDTPSAHTHPPASSSQEDFRDGPGGTGGGGMVGQMGMGMMSMGIGMTHPHQHLPQQSQQPVVHQGIGIGTPPQQSSMSMADLTSMGSSSIPQQQQVQAGPTTGVSQAQANRITAQRSMAQESVVYGAKGMVSSTQQDTHHQRRMDQQQQQQQQQQTGFGSAMGHHQLHHMISAPGQQRVAAQAVASAAGFGTPHDLRLQTQFRGDGTHQQHQHHNQQDSEDSDSLSPHQLHPTITTTTTSSSMDSMDTGMDMDTSFHGSIHQHSSRRQQTIGSGPAYPVGSFPDRRIKDEPGSTELGLRGGGRRGAEDEGAYPPSTATTTLGASPSPGRPEMRDEDNDDDNNNNIKNKHDNPANATSKNSSKSEPPPPRGGGGHSFLGRRGTNNDIDRDNTPSAIHSSSTGREKERGQPFESLSRPQWYGFGGPQYATVPPQYAYSGRDVYSVSAVGHPSQFEQQQRRESAISNEYDGYDTNRGHPASAATGSSTSDHHHPSLSTRRTSSQIEQYDRISTTTATSRSAGSTSEPSSPSSSPLPSGPDDSPRTEFTRSTYHERTSHSNRSPFSYSRPPSSRSGVPYDHVSTPLDARFDRRYSDRVFSHDARGRSRSSRVGSRSRSRSGEGYESDSDSGPNDGGWGGRPVTAPAAASWGSSGPGYGSYGGGGYPQYQYAPHYAAYGGYSYGSWGYPSYPSHPYTSHHHPHHHLQYQSAPYGPSGSSRMDSGSMGRGGSGIYERESSTSESPFSFHPPALERPLTGPGISGGGGSSSSAAAAPGTATGRKRTVPDSEFDSYGRPGTSSGGGVFAFGRPDTANASSRPQSRRLTVMEICNDGPPAGSSAGGRFISLSRPTTADSRVLPPPGSGVSFAAAGVNIGSNSSSSFRPDSSGGSPFAFVHPGDRSAASGGGGSSGGRGWEGDRSATPPTRARENSEEAAGATGANAERSGTPSERNTRPVSGSFKFNGDARRAREREGDATDTASKSRSAAATATATAKSKSESKSSPSQSSSTPTASPTPTAATAARGISRISSSRSPPAARSPSFSASKSPLSKSSTVHSPAEHSSKLPSQCSPKQTQSQSPQHPHTSSLSVSSVAVDVNSNLRDGVRA